VGLLSKLGLTNGGIRLNIRKISGKIRYGTCIIFTRIISPNLFKKFVAFGLCHNSIFPRPSIEMMLKYFKNKKVIGAEIGVNKGKNAKSILKVLNINQLYLIDSWEIKQFKEGYKNYKTSCKKFKNKSNVKIIKSSSLDANILIKDNSLDFCYIDASHDYNDVYQDIEIWTKKVKINGIIAGHDIFSFIDVFKAINNYCLKNKLSYEINAPDWYFIKKEGLRDD